MKQEASKKNKKWLWLVAGLAALLVIAGVVLALVLPEQGGQQTPETVSSPLYWNVDRLNWIDGTGLSTRTAGEDGLVHVRFAVGGELVEMPIVDKQLVNYIDSMNVMGLAMDSNGVVIDALDPKTVATEVAKEVFVRKVEGNQILLNSSLAMNGMDIYVNVTDATGIYDVDPDAEAIGQTAVPETMDKVYVYANEAGETTDIFICERAVEAGVYWRVEKKYDSEKHCTSREPDENGAYTILFAHNGEQVELKCKDKDLVNTIDAANNIYAEFALVLDEEGYIVDEVDVGLALKGIKECNNYDVTAVEGNSFTAVRNLAGSDKGKEYSNTWDESCDIFLMENGCDAEFVGQRVDGLKVGDRITVYTDLESNPILIFVVNREVDSPMYYRLDKYSTKNGVTLRPKDANGYYVFEMACQGKTVKLRCKDDYVATRIEWRNPGMMGLKLEGDVIVDLHPASCVCGWSTAFNNYYVASVSAPIVTLINVATGNTYNRLLAEGAEVYDVTGNYGMEKGAATTLQAGDLVTCARNIADELTHVYVLQHYEKNAKLYYNMNRKYNSTTKETNRTPDENGYYVFEMLCEGKQYTLKTKSKKMANWIESQSTSMVALTVSGNIIKNAFTHVTAFEYGYRPVNYNYVRSINKADNSFTTYYYDGDVVKENKNGSTGEPNVWKMAKDCVVYNVSAAYASQRGEKTTLKVDDQIQTFARQDTGEIFLILVFNRKVDSPLYWHKSQKYNSTKKETTRVADANGWYIYELYVNGELKQFKTNDKEIANKVDSYSMAFALSVKGDVIQNAYPSNVAKNVKGVTASHYDITQIKGNELSLTRTRPLAGDYGKTAQITMYKGTKIYDVSNYAENRGAKATLSLGDRVSVYTNMDGKAEYIYINYKNTHEKGHISYCEHCDKEVLWEPYSQTFYETDGHYYIPADMTSWSQKQIGYPELKEGQEQFEIVLDLNGKTVTARNRLVLVYSKFTVLDTVGGGKVIGENAANGNGGVIMVTGGGQLNVRGGELTLAETAGCSKEGGIVYAGSRSTFNMYGGTIAGGKASLKEGATGTPVGGNVFVGTSTFNMYGGTITGGTAVGGTGGNLYLNNLATFNMEGGTIAGAFEFANGAKITLSGAPVISGTGLSIDRGALVKLGELKSGASVTVKAREQFTEISDKAENYVNCFKAAEAGASIEARDNALYYVAPPADYVSDLEFAEGTTRAECPQCGKVVTWTAIDQATYGETAIAKHANNVTSVHYYLAEDITYTGTDSFFTALDSYMQNGQRVQKTACFHLNGHNFTATAARAFQGNTGILNIMGTGIVSGNYTGKPGEWSGNNNATLGINTTIQEGTVNLFAGTYTKAADNVQPIVNIYNNGGTIILHEDATIDGTGTSGLAVNVCNGTFVMYGGRIIAGSDNAVQVTNYSATAQGAFGIFGGTVTGGIEVQKGTTMALTGAPVIEGAGINMTADTLLMLGELSGDASIKIFANGVFAEGVENAEAVADCFVPANTGDSIKADGTSLRYEMKQWTVTEDLVFDEGTKNAFCAVCQKKVTWTELNQEKNGETAMAAPSAAASHYYLSEDVVYTGTATGFITAGGTYNDNGTTVQKTVCVHLNGHDLTATQTRAFFGNVGILNVLGEGTVSGNANATTGSTVLINCQHGMGIINLYSGTYTKPETNDKAPILYINTNGGNINVYADATIDGTGRTAGSNPVGAAVFGGTREVNANQGPASLSVLGGKIIGGVSIKTRYASFAMNGGEIDGVVAVENGDKLSLAGAAKIKELTVAAGKLLDVSGLTGGARINVTASGIFTKDYDKITDVATYIKPVSQSAKITVKGKALSCDKDYTGELKFTEGTKKAFCVVCDKEVTWTEINQTTNGTTALAAPTVATSHYYLSEDITYTGTTAFITAGGTYNNNGTTAQKTSCLHLNGNDLTVTQARVLAGNAGILNVMGEGTVTGGYVGTSDYAKSTGATIQMNTTGTNGTINLYGGTYTKAEGSPNATLVVHDNGGKVNVYEGATVEGGAAAYHGKLNVYGAQISGGLKVLTRTSGKSPVVTVTDAQIDSVSVTNGSFTLAGASRLSLAVAEGKKITLGEVTEGAAITVSATGVFTETNEKAADYVQFFTAATEGDSVEAQDNALVYVKAN